MKNSRTSTNNKNKNVKQKSSTSPSSATSKNTKSNNINKKIRSSNYKAREDQEYNYYIKNKSNSEEYDRSKKSRSFTILKITFFIGFLSVMGYLCFNMETFNLGKIEVEGNVKYGDEEIINNTDLDMGKNVFKQILLKDRKIETLPYIFKLKYLYSFPNGIVIKVEERYPLYIALDKNTGKYYKIDNEGVLLEQCGLEQKNDEILVEGFAFEENPKYGKLINDTYIDKLDYYNDIKTKLKEYEISGNITKVNFSNSLTIITLDGKLNIVFANDSNLNYKVSFLKGILEQGEGVTEGTIDMSIDNPVYSKY